jgi:hypothetical protein
MFDFEKVKYKSKEKWILEISKMKWIVQLQKYVIFHCLRERKRG